MGGATTTGKSEIRRPTFERKPNAEIRIAPGRRPPSGFGFRPSDLDIICLKCLQKDPARRYATAEALAEDLERWLRHEPILARPSSVWERALKWARRHPARAGLLALALLAPAVIITVLLVMGAKLRHERNLALTQKSLALSEARRAETNALTARQNSYAADMFLAARALEIGNLGLARRTLLAHVPRAGEEDLRGFEWRHYWHRAQGQQERVLGGFSNAVNSVAFSPDGRWLAAGGGNLVHKWDTTNFALAATSQHDAKALVNSVAFSADGSTLWTGDQKGQVRVWLDGLARPLVEFSRGTGFVHLALPAGAAGPIAIGERDGTEGGAHGAVALYGVTDLLTRNERGNVLTNSGGLAAVSRNGQWLLTGGGESPVTLHNLKTGEARNLGGWTQLLMALALSPDGTRAAISASNGHGVGLYNFSSNGQPYWTTVTFSWRCRALAYSPNGQTLAAASYDHTIRLLSASQGNQVHRLDGHTDQALAVAFSPDGKTLASSGQDGTVRLWNLTTLERDKMTNLYAPFIVSRDGRTIYASDEDTWTAHVRRLDLADPARARESLLRLRAERFPDVQPSHAGLLRWKFEGGATPEQWAQLEQFIGRHTGRILWRSGPEGRPTGPDRPIDRVTYPSASAADGSVVALVDGKNLHLWHNFTSRPLPDLPSPPPGILRLALSDDGHRLALATTVGNIVSVWDTPAGTNVFRLPPRASVVNELLFSPDGRTLLVAGADVAVQLRDARTGELQTTLTGHEVGIVCAAFSPDGRTLATAGQGGLKLWHLPTRREVGTVNVGATWLQFSPDGALLVAADWRGDAYLLRAPHRHDAGPPP